MKPNKSTRTYYFFLSTCNFENAVFERRRITEVCGHILGPPHSQLPFFDGKEKPCGSSGGTSEGPAMRAPGWGEGTSDLLSAVSESQVGP